MATDRGPPQPRDHDARCPVGGVCVRASLGPETKTHKNYRASWSGLVNGLRERLGREPLVSDLSTESLTTYLRDAREARGWNEQSTKTNAGNIKSVISKSEKKHLLAPGTLAGFELPKVTKSAGPVTFDDATLAMIFDALEHRRTALNLRLRVVANIMLDCGARPAEVAATHVRRSLRGLVADPVPREGSEGAHRPGR